MPIHDWTQVEVDIFHAFQLGWITSRALNHGAMPHEYYALPELVAPKARFDITDAPNWYASKK